MLSSVSVQRERLIIASLFGCHRKTVERSIRKVRSHRLASAQGVVNG
jgi:hypothetical protein